MEFLPNFKEIINSQLDRDLTIILFIVFTCSLMSACLANSISEKRAHKRLIHTLAGFILPIIYPLFIAVSLPQKADKKKKKEVRKPEETTTTELPIMDLDEKYFKQIYLDSEGTPTGPYLIDMEENIVKAEFIIEVHPDFIVIENINGQGKKQRMRIPYNKMTSCTLIEEETTQAQHNDTEKVSDNVNWIELEDEEMQEAILQAQKNFHTFKEELDLDQKRIVSTVESHGVKAYIKDKGGRGEYLFVRDIQIEGNTISGTLASPPQIITHLSKDEELNFTLDKVSDWFYVIDGKGHGGYTLRLILSRMSDQERQMASQQQPMMWFI